MADPPCPLNPSVMLQLETGMNLARLLDIEKHVESSSCFHPPLKEIFFHGSLDGSTPLLVACGEGQLESVKRIIQHWRDVDVNAAGNYYHLHQGAKVKILRATPLIIASLLGHSDIVDCLISKGANVSASACTEGLFLTTSFHDDSGLNPLLGALVADDRPGQSFFEKCAKRSIIVRLLLEAGADPNTLDAIEDPLWTKPFCGVDATTALVNRGLNLNKRNSKGKTIVHHWIDCIPDISEEEEGISEEERSEIIQFLANRGADLKAEDDNGFTPILLAAESTRLCILEGLLAREDIDREDKIHAMELTGSHLILESGQLDEAVGYWRRALSLREGADPVKKIPLLMSCGRTVEWVTSEDLGKVKPSEYWIQSLLTRLRIYAEKNLKKALEECVRYYFDCRDFDPDDNYFEEESLYYGMGVPKHYDRVTFMLAILETIPRIPSISYIPCVVQELFTTSAHLERDDPFFSEENITSSLQLISTVNPVNWYTIPTYQFFVKLAGLPEALFHGDIRNYLSHAARRDYGFNLLHAIQREDFKTLRFLLHLGGDSNAMDYYRAQPLLHTAAVREEHPAVLEGKFEREQVSNEMEYTPAHLLFDYGANPYWINHEGKTAVDIWIEKNCGGKGMQSEAWNHRPHWCRDTVPKLTCLAAKTIHTHAISYSNPDDLPENHPHRISEKLYKFLENH